MLSMWLKSGSLENALMRAAMCTYFNCLEFMGLIWTSFVSATSSIVIPMWYTSVSGDSTRIFFAGDLPYMKPYLCVRFLHVAAICWV